jgi:hypothetical protein
MVGRGIGLVCGHVAQGCGSVRSSICGSRPSLVVVAMYRAGDMDEWWEGPSGCVEIDC